MPVMRHWTVYAICETCKREFYTRLAGKFCDRPTCAGYLHHIHRPSHRRRNAS